MILYVNFQCRYFPTYESGVFLSGGGRNLIFFEEEPGSLSAGGGGGSKPEGGGGGERGPAWEESVRVE